MALNVLYEDNHLLAVNKPAGMLVQGDQTGDICLLDLAKDYIKIKYQKPGNVFTGLVHRLDRPVSGVVVMARTSKALTRMNRLFQERMVRKEYWAIVGNPPPQQSGRLVHWLYKNTKTNRTQAIREKNHGKESILDYVLLAARKRYYLLQILPHTGRSHQIRVQLMEIGSPIVGDVKYGYPAPHGHGGISLHAKSLEFVHPIKKEALKIEASLPSSEDWMLFKDF